MHPYALLYYPFHYACYIVFGVFWRLGVMLIRLFYFFVALLFYSIPPIEQRKRVVVVGGGFAGSYVSQHLEDFFHVTLIDTKDYFEFTPSVLRTIVEPTHIKKLQVIHNHYLKSATVIQKEVLAIKDDCVVLDDQTIPFDYLVINTGSSYNQPFKETKLIGSARASTLRESNYAIRKVNKILIIGGGLVGVELAAEIASHFPGKEVTLVHSRSDLIERFPKKAIRYVTNFLKSRGVRLILNERVVAHHGQTFVTDQGTQVIGEMAFLCTGIKPNSSLLKDQYSGAITEAGYIRVTDHLQLMSNIIYPNIFVCGDVVDMKEEKLAQGAEVMGSLVVNNIFCMERGRVMEKYTSPYARPVLISLGKFHGVFVYGKWAVCGPLPALLKEAVEWKTLVRYI